MDCDKLIERLRKEAYGSDIEDLLLGASTAIETLWDDLARVTAERNAAQALLAEISGVIGSAPITTAFGIPLERLRELAQADREGRVRIAGRPPLEDECCGNCGHFRRIAGTRRGDCSVHGYIKNRLGQEDRSRGRFTPFQSRKACRQFQRRTDDDGRSDPEG